MKTSLLQVIVLAVSGWSAIHAVDTDPEPLRAAVEEATSSDPAIAAAAIVALRKQGPSGLRALLERHANALGGLNKDPGDQRITRLRNAIDAVCAQRDGHASKLFWFTDLREAQAAAEASGKPILSLRLLGKLSDEFSCANSRFFRTALYANSEIAAYLREHYILHWKSVRPVPRLTIDFGDGRVVQRTITGNSIHYILDGEGTVIDALPGLYGPRAFLDQVRRPRTPHAMRAAFSERSGRSFCASIISPGSKESNRAGLPIRLRLERSRRSGPWPIDWFQASRRRPRWKRRTGRLGSSLAKVPFSGRAFREIHGRSREHRPTKM